MSMLKNYWELPWDRDNSIRDEEVVALRNYYELARDGISKGKGTVDAVKQHSLTSRSGLSTKAVLALIEDSLFEKSSIQTVRSEIAEVCRALANKGIQTELNELLAERLGGNNMVIVVDEDSKGWDEPQRIKVTYQFNGSPDGDGPTTPWCVDFTTGTHGDFEGNWRNIKNVEYL